MWRSSEDIAPVRTSRSARAQTHACANAPLELLQDQTSDDRLMTNIRRQDVPRRRVSAPEAQPWATTDSDFDHPTIDIGLHNGPTGISRHPRLPKSDEAVVRTTLPQGPLEWWGSRCGVLEVVRRHQRIGRGFGLHPLRKRRSSGASGSVVSDRSLPHVPNEPSNGSAKGVQYVAASWNSMPNRGDKTARLIAKEVFHCLQQFQVSDVRKPLMSAPRICDPGHTVTFCHDAGSVVHFDHRAGNLVPPGGQCVPVESQCPRRRLGFQQAGTLAPTEDAHAQGTCAQARRKRVGEGHPEARILRGRAEVRQGVGVAQRAGRGQAPSRGSYGSGAIRRRRQRCGGECGAGALRAGVCNQGELGV